MKSRFFTLLFLVVTLFGSKENLYGSILDDYHSFIYNKIYAQNGLGKDPSSFCAECPCGCKKKKPACPQDKS